MPSQGVFEVFFFRDKDLAGLLAAKLLIKFPLNSIWIQIESKVIYQVLSGGWWSLTLTRMVASATLEDENA